MDGNTTQLENLREDYRASSLDIVDVSDLPMEQFKKWFEQAQNSNLPEPNAFVLATATAKGRVSQRTLLLKGLRENGFIFYTNYNSQKGKELEENPRASMVFLWLGLQRQIRVEGWVEKISTEDSERYFKSRPKGSQIGAWASAQSSVIEERKILEEQFSAIEEKFKDQNSLPCPKHWGGYIIRPDRIEFWQGRSSRLHDRISYRLEGEDWKIERLAP